MVTAHGSQQDFQKIPVLGLVPESSATASPPSSPTNGQLWYDSTINRLKIRENGAWVLNSQTGAELVANKDQASGYPGLDGSSKIAIAQIPTGTSGTTVPFGNDSRFTDSRAPSGSAGGDLTGTYPNPTVALLAITDAKVAAANKDGVAGTASMRTIGTGATQAMAGNTRLDTIAAPTGSVSLNSQKITSLATPTLDTDAATKLYVDLARQGLRQKDAVRVATTGNITLSGTQTIDGVAVIATNRVLVKDQSTAANNGIYLVAAGAWTRATDADTAAEVGDGTVTFIQEGTANNATSWAQISPITTLGTDAQSWVIQGSATSYLAGNGLTLTGSTFDVVGTTNRISVSADAIDISSSYVGQTSITTLGTITAGTWTGTTIAIANGGTGATSAAAARTALSATGKYAATLGALVAGVETTITHSLNTTDVIASFKKLSNSFEEGLSWRTVDANTIGVTADLAYSASALRVTVIG